MATNTDRADRADLALSGFYLPPSIGAELPSEDAAGNLSFLLTDLMHWADNQGVSFDDALADARYNHEAEVLEAKP